MDVKEQTIRRSEGRGEKELRGVMAFIPERISARDAGWKSLRSLRLVIRRVFVGGEGWERGGKLERSSESEEGRRRADGDVAKGGFILSDCMRDERSMGVLMLIVKRGYIVVVRK